MTNPRRTAIILVTALAAFWMYADRVCISTLAVSIRTDLGIDKEKMSFALGAFFFSYAIFQVPMGLLADRHGPRIALTLCIIGWSLTTMATAFAQGLASLLMFRLLLGISESGAYPTAARLIASWATPAERGRLSGIVSFGGRLGGAVAPIAAGFIGVALVGWGPESWSASPSKVNWPAVFFLFGASGLLVAVAFYLIVRDRPDATSFPGSAKPSFTFAELEPIVKSANLWYSGAAQFWINFGWAFLVTLLPTYLSETFSYATDQQGYVQSIPLFASCAGALVGGVIADAVRPRLGARWGRSVPLAVAMLSCAFASALIPFLNTPWAILTALTASAFLLDSGLPAMWAFTQDIGGKQVAAAHGWGNMWGNLGAAVSPVALTTIRGYLNWDAVFAACALSFVFAALLGTRLDATKPIAKP